MTTQIVNWFKYIQIITVSFGILSYYVAFTFVVKTDLIWCQYVLYIGKPKYTQTCLGLKVYTKITFALHCMCRLY